MRKAPLATFVCRQCTPHISKRFASNSIPPKSKKSPTPPPPPTKQSSKTSISSSTPKSTPLKPTPLPSPKSNSAKSTPSSLQPPLFSHNVSSKSSPPVKSSSSSPPPQTKSSPSSSPPPPSQSSQKQFTPPILTPKQKSSPPPTSPSSSSSPSPSGEQPQKGPTPQQLQERVTARNKLFEELKDQQKDVAGSAFASRQRAYEDFLNELQTTEKKTPAPTPIKINKEEEKKKAMEDLNKYMGDDFDTHLTAATTPKNKAKNAIEIKEDTTDNKQNQAEQPATKTQPNINKNDKNNNNPENKKKEKPKQTTVTGYGVPSLPQLIYQPQTKINPYNFKQNGKTIPGLETRESKVTDFMNHFRTSMAQGKLPDPTKMSGMFTIAVPKRDSLRDNVEKFAASSDKKKQERLQEQEKAKELKNSKKEKEEENNKSHKIK